MPLRRLRSCMTVPRRLWLLGVLLILAACGETTATPIVTDTTCLVFEELTFDSSIDSAETIRGISRHNSAFRSLCSQA